MMNGKIFSSHTEKNYYEILVLESSISIELAEPSMIKSEPIESTQVYLTCNVISCTMYSFIRLS